MTLCIGDSQFHTSMKDYAGIYVVAVREITPFAIQMDLTHQPLPSHFQVGVGLPGMGLLGSPGFTGKRNVMLAGIFQIWCSLVMILAENSSK